MNEPIYLLYGGSSADGCGPGVFQTYTTDSTAAHRFFVKISGDPYSTGHVDILTKTAIHRASKKDFAAP